MTRFQDSYRQWETDIFNDRLAATAIKDAIREGLREEARQILWRWLDQFNAPKRIDSRDISIPIYLDSDRRQGRKYLNIDFRGQDPYERLRYIRRHIVENIDQVLETVMNYLKAVRVEEILDSVPLSIDNPIRFIEFPRLGHETQSFRIYFQLRYRGSDLRLLIKVDRKILWDELCFIIENGEPIQGLRLSGDAYRIYGTNRNFTDEEERHWESLSETDQFDQLQDVPKLLRRYFRNLDDLFPYLNLDYPGMDEYDDDDY